MDGEPEKVARRLDKAESDVAEIKVNVAVLKTDVSHITGGLSDLRRDVSEFRVETKRDVSELRKHQERDFRALFGAIIFVALSLAGLMAKGFGWFH